MDIIDCHLHAEALSEHSLALMAVGGVKAVISHTSLPEVSENIPSQAIFDFTDRILGFHSQRVSEFLIDTYVCIGVCCLFVPTDYEKALEKLPSYLKDRRVVGVGEICLDARSETCPDLAKQEEILRAQLSIARDCAKPVTIHTPPTEKRNWVERYLTIVQELKLNPNQVIIDHADDSVVKIITDSGCNAAVTVQPWRKLTPADAAKMMQAADLDRVLVDSDYNCILESDPLAVPKTAFEMGKLGMKESDIMKVVWENPRRLFKLD